MAERLVFGAVKPCSCRGAGIVNRQGRPVGNPTLTALPSTIRPVGLTGELELTVGHDDATGERITRIVKRCPRCLGLGFLETGPGRSF